MLHDALARGITSPAIATAGLDERILSWNAGAETSFGYPASKAIGCPMADLPIVPPESCDRALLLALCAEERVVVIDGWWTRPDGTRFWGDGAVHALEAVVPTMLEEGRGQIVGTASVAGYRGLPGAEAYGATKAALLARAIEDGLVRPEDIAIYRTQAAADRPTP